jgi:hypothetical protein
MLAREGDKLGQLRYVAFHAKDAIGHDPAAGFAAVLLQLRFEIVQVAVLVDFAGDRFAHQADAVDDAGVIELVGQNDVVGTDQRRKQSFVRCPTAYIGESLWRADEAGDRFLDLAVTFERAADKADGGRAGAVRLQAFDTRCDDFRVIREPEVVV